MSLRSESSHKISVATARNSYVTTVRTKLFCRYGQNQIHCYGLSIVADRTNHSLATAIINSVATDRIKSTAMDYPSLRIEQIILSLRSESILSLRSKSIPSLWSELYPSLWIICRCGSNKQFYLYGQNQITTFLSLRLETIMSL